MIDVIAMADQTQSVRIYTLTLTGSSATRAMLPAVEAHMRCVHTGSVFKPFSDFGGRFNPLAEVHMTTTKDAIDGSIAWMQGYSAKRSLGLSVRVEDIGPAQVANGQGQNGQTDQTS